MKMPGNQRRLDIGVDQFAPNPTRSRALPDGVLDVYDRRHQRHKAEIALHQRQQRADPTAVAGGEHAELAAAAFPQCAHQLPQFNYPLAQSLCIANEIAGDRKFAIPIAAWDPRKVIGEVKETSVPTKFVEALCA